MIFPSALMLKNRESGESRLFGLSLLGPEDASKLYDFQQAQLPTIQDPQTFQPLSREELEYALSHGITIGVYAGEELCYFLNCLYPTPADNLGLDLGLAPEELPHVAHLEVAISSPAARGWGIHQKVLELGLRLLGEDGRTRWVCATISPFNLPSLKPALKAGLEIAQLKEKYGGLLRYILVKELPAADTSRDNG